MQPQSITPRHGNRWSTGRLNLPVSQWPPKQRDEFLSRIGPEEANGCRNWQGNTQTRGYGSFNCQGKNFLAHRVVWELSNGPVPEGLYVLHQCDNPTCVRLDHLFVGTPHDNMLDKEEKGRARYPGPKNPARGEKSAQSMLTEEDVRIIYRRLCDGEIMRVLSEEYGGVTIQSIWAIKYGHSWNHVTGLPKPPEAKSKPRRHT